MKRAVRLSNFVLNSFLFFFTDPIIMCTHIFIPVFTPYLLSVFFIHVSMRVDSPTSRHNSVYALRIGPVARQALEIVIYVHTICTVSSCELKYHWSKHDCFPLNLRRTL